jgi:hypothetical protein
VILLLLFGLMDEFGGADEMVLWVIVVGRLGWRVRSGGRLDR